MSQSPETSMSVTFLLKLADITGERRYRQAALKAMDAVLAEIVPDGRWEDFETYWSCCSFGKEEFLGRRVPRSGMYKQCNFSMFWTAEALLDCYRADGQRPSTWRGAGASLDEMSMTQQVWQPPYIYIPALGGFGVMNFDGEWNDSRECLFAELFMEYYRETGDPHLFERGVAALKSSFVMMYCPENPQAKALWEKVWPFFGPADYGFTMENYGHIGRGQRGGRRHWRVHHLRLGQRRGGRGAQPHPRPLRRRVRRPAARPSLRHRQRRRQAGWGTLRTGQSESRRSRGGRCV